jgi:hypothetical protein
VSPPAPAAGTTTMPAPNTQVPQSSSPPTQQ